MRVESLEHMTRGWFVGDFEPSLYKTRDCEVGVKEYKSGDCETKHYHKVATEITVVISGEIRMFDSVYHANDIIIVEPGDETSFEALTDAVLTVVKIPGAINDKYLCED